MIGNVSDRAVTVVQFDYRITRFCPMKSSETKNRVIYYYF